MISEGAHQHIWPAASERPSSTVCRSTALILVIPIVLVTHPDVSPHSCSDALESAWYRHLPAPQGLIGRRMRSS